jgi:phage tail sheath protein FI
VSERLTPGVYVEEISSGVRPIQGVGTSTAAFIGEAARGVPDQAAFVNGYASFERAFGGPVRGEAGFLAQAVQAFFAARGARNAFGGAAARSDTFFLRTNSFSPTTPASLRAAAARALPGTDESKSA